MRTADTVLTWNSEALRQGAAIWDTAKSLNSFSVEELRHEIDILIEKFSSANKYSSVDDWIKLAAVAVRCHGHLNCEHVVKIVCDKQRDYGPSNILKFSFYGLVVRLNDKVSRLENLINKNKNAVFESISDTYCDIVGYCIIGMLLASGGFFLPLESA